VRVERTFRDGHTETWWALEVDVGPYGPEKRLRAVVATTDPATLPEHSTWYLTTTLPAPGSARAREHGAVPAADLAEIVRLYGLRNWVEQSYKQTRGALGWGQYQVRTDRAIRRHWVLVCCAFSFCWYHMSRSVESGDQPAPVAPVVEETTGRGENGAHAAASAAALLAGSAAGRPGVAGAVDHALALLDRVVESAPANRASPAP